jgi:SAM-dependent methyltransferase
MSLDTLEAAYARRNAADPRYHPLNPVQLQALQERERALAALLRRQGLQDTAALQAAELGCGGGQNLLTLLRLGFAPEHLRGVELLPERLAAARALLPPAVQLLAGDARTAAIEPASQHLVLLATVLSSVLDDALQQQLADTAWRWLRPGGWLLCYDFAFDNPANPDVRGVPVRRLRQLWPQAVAEDLRRLTLAPPLARRLPAALIAPVNACLPWLRTHRLIALRKP